MKKIFLISLSILMCFISTGCMAGIFELTVNEDSSVDAFIQVGVSEKAYNLMNSMAQDGDSSSSAEDMTKFTYNGVNYYGEVKREKLNSIEELNTTIGEDTGTAVESGEFNIVKNFDGTYTLTLVATNETGNTSEMESNMEINNIDEATMKMLMGDMVMLYTINMPAPVIQTNGSSNGITINGNKLVIDCLKLDVPSEPNQKIVYTFTTLKQDELPVVGEKPISDVKTNQKFSDVPENLWSYTAINKLAESGLVSGVGYGRFSPDRGMKIAEFCQVLANATGLESGAENDYWATKAIKSCIEKGYIYSHGDVIPQNYDVVITREEAIAAMQIASGRAPLAGKNITIEDIPDGDQISDQYKAAVLQAYNSEITTGVNEYLKFSPKNQLTRAQVCQLFYNVDWTTKLY